MCRFDFAVLHTFDLADLDSDERPLSPVFRAALVSPFFLSLLALAPGVCLDCWSDMRVTLHSPARCCGTYHGIVDCVLDNLSVFWHIQGILGESQHIFDFGAHKAWCEGAIDGIASAG